MDRLHNRLATMRLLVFTAGVLLAILAYRDALSPWWLVLPLAGFIALIQRHDRVLRARDNAARLVEFYERGLARLEDRWIGTGDSGDRFRDDDHLYANDLDLFGRGSLFELLSLARTRAGEATLAHWLMHPAAPPEIAARHGAVRELTPALDLREALSLAGARVRATVHPDALTSWASAPAPGHPRQGQLRAVLLTLVFLGLMAGWAATGMIALLLLAVALRVVYQQLAERRTEAILQAADTAARDLVVLGEALRALERETFTAPRLASLRASLDTTGRASYAIRSLERLIEMHDWAHNIVFTPIAALLMWSTHLAWAVERWRQHHGPHVSAWLRVVGDFEALSSVAAYAYEHPDDPFPELLDADRIPELAATGLGHPLLPGAAMVRNDVTLGRAPQLLVVSGSNMSGKSTLLRTVGINVVLALAGAPVRAASLRLSPVAIGATLRIQDSLQEGRSRFYAEITRLGRVADASARGPLLFLLDELFHGTNSHDRVVGAAGVLRALLDRGAVGLVTTHDLAVTAVATGLGPRAANVHFEDWFDGGEMRFDYRMKPGPVTRSNALALMRAVGLDVPHDER